MGRIAIVGAGIAGLACGRALADRGFTVALFDKGRKAGGRMSSRQGDTYRRPPRRVRSRRAVHDRARSRVPGAARGVADGGSRCAVAGGGRRSLGRRAHDERSAPGARPGPARPLGNAGGEPDSRSVRLAPAGEGLDEGSFRAVLTALPAEQTATLLRNVAPDFARIAGDTPSAPCWTAMAAFSQRLAIPEDVMRPEGAVGWAARNAAKPGRPPTEAWVIQAARTGPAPISNARRRPSRRLARRVLRRRRDRTRGARQAHRAPLALRPLRRRRPPVLWQAGSGLGACGDWLTGPRVENAWISGAASPPPSPRIFRLHRFG